MTNIKFEIYHPTRSDIVKNLDGKQIYDQLLHACHVVYCYRLLGAFIIYTAHKLISYYDSLFKSQRPPDAKNERD